MSLTAAALRELHRLHNQLADLKGRIERGPRMVKGAEANVAKQQAVVDAAHAEVRKQKMKADQMQLDLKSSEAKVKDWQNQLNTCASNKEYQTLQDQIAAAEMAGSVAADEILELLERIDELEKSAKATEDDLAARKEERDRIAKQVADTAEGLRSDVARIENELAEAEKNIPGDLKDDYRRVIRQKGADGLAESEEGVCTGCGQSMTKNSQNELMLGKPTFCKACGRLLYLPE